jgi:hypothetical protein
MELSSSQREEEGELSTERVRRDQPLLGFPVPPYIGVPRVTTVTWTKRQQLPSKQDMLTMAGPLDFLPNCSRCDSTSLYDVLPGP